MAEWRPRPDQRPVLDWLDGRQRGAVWAGTGAGKTVMAATWLDQLLFDRFSARRVAIVAPKLVARQGWPDQLRRWAHLHRLAGRFRVLSFDDLALTEGQVLTWWADGVSDCRTLPRGTLEVDPADPARIIRHGRVPPSVSKALAGPGPFDLRRGGLAFRDKRETKRRLQAMTETIHVMSWDAFPFVEEAYGANWPYDVLVLDEASFVRDQSSERGRAARRAVHTSGVVQSLLELTASPNANHDEALWNPLDLIERGCLGENLTAFRETYCVPDSKNRQTGQVYSWKLAPSMRPAFQATCARLAISVPESLGIDVLPVEHWVELPPEARAEYDRMREDNVLDDVTAGSAAVVALKLRQLASGFVYDDTGKARTVHTLKQDKLRELVESIDGPALVAFTFDWEAEWLAGLFGKDVADIRKRGAMQRFIDGKLKLLAVHPASAGHGIDGLQGVTNHVIWPTVPDDRELYDQTNGRLKRPGQAEKTVKAHMLIAKDTREQDIWRYVLPGKLSNMDLTLRAARVRVEALA